MVLVANEVVDALSLLPTAVEQKYSISDNLAEMVNLQYKDIYQHYYSPITISRQTNKKVWVQQAYDLFPGIRYFTPEEKAIHRAGLRKVFKPTGRNFFKK